LIAEGSNVGGRVEGKVAFITGAARGVGRAMAVRLAEEGADIVAFDLCAPADPIGQQYPAATDADLALTVEQVEALGRTIVAGKGDVRDFEALAAVVREGIAELGRIDIVAANAASLKMGVETHAASEAEWDEMIGVNLTGVWNTVRATVPTLIDQGDGGSITITSSLAGFKGTPLLGAYTVAKHGVVGLMRTLALELGRHQIRVNTIHPTSVDTPMGLNDTMFKLFRPELEHPTRADFEPTMVEKNVLPVATVDARDIANALLFLASDDARYVTGVTMPVDAGANIR
jgi:SDR family mycofactocin-dependent oxidoreductase